MFRRRLTIIAFLASTSFLPLGCARRDGSVVTTVNTTALRDSIIAALPPDGEFRTDTDSSGVANFPVEKFLWIFWATNKGTIQPHMNAHAGIQYSHLKFLARIRVTKRYHGLEPGDWNYWVAARIATSRFPQGEWVSVYVAPTVQGHIEFNRLLYKAHSPSHTSARARFYNTETYPWATCGTNMCCCEDNLHCP
jgi:hypothetical protein